MIPRLIIVIPCYNEQEVLPITAPQFLAKINQLASEGLISGDSRVMFVNDGSKDDTWNIIQRLADQDEHYIGIAQSRNRGHQNAVLAGLMEAKDMCDITISIDCDGQDDINAMDEMVKAYLEGCEIVYGVRSKRDTDTFFKRFTAESFYKLLNSMGAEVVFNHADYRLISSRALQELAKFKEVNIFLRGMVPLVGFKSTSVYYERSERAAGRSSLGVEELADRVDSYPEAVSRILSRLADAGYVGELATGRRRLTPAWALLADPETKTLREAFYALLVDPHNTLVRPESAQPKKGEGMLCEWYDTWTREHTLETPLSALIEGVSLERRPEGEAAVDSSSTSDAQSADLPPSRA